MLSLMSLGPDFNHFGHKFWLKKIFLDVPETKCWTKSFSDSHDSACFFDIISPMSLQVLLLALSLGGTSKTHVFKKIY